VVVVRVTGTEDSTTVFGASSQVKLMVVVEGSVGPEEGAAAG
jgi:hypothetical protein